MYKKIKKFLIISSELNINYTKDVLSIIKDKDIYKILIPLIFGAIFIISLFTNGHISDYTYTYLLEPKDLLLMLGIAYVYTFFVFYYYIPHVLLGTLKQYHYCLNQLKYFMIQKMII